MQESQPIQSRRGFFIGAAAVGAATAAVSTLPALRAAAAPAPEAHPAPPAKGGGYHLSEHVKRYYQTTRL